MKQSYRGAIAALCLLTLCVACSSSSESGSETQIAIQQFYDSLGAGDYPAVLGMYTSDVRQMLELPGGEVDENYQDWAKGETKDGKVDRIEIVEESVETDTAEVKYRVVYGDGSTAERSVKMTREEGQWKLGFIDNA